jgi:hypothetical protein
MAIRRLNYTGRKRIQRVHAQVGVLHGNLPGDVARFVTQLDLAKYLFPQDATIVVEAYRQSSSMRFSYGTVALPREVDEPVLTDFDVIEAVKFRVKVVASDGSGRVLGEADQISPMDMEREESPREGLLPVMPDDLRHQLWWLDFDEAGPILLISKRSGDWKGFARSPHFQWLVLPVVLRLILERVIDLGIEADDSDAGWENRWLRFVARLPGIGAQPRLSASEEEKQQWIQEACAAFAKLSSFVDKFSTTLFPEDGA